MQIINSLQEMQLLARQWRKDGQKIAFVPTMGALHDGHLSLLSEGRARGDKLVLSIYVNPLQFGKNEDLSKYPRDLDADLAKVRPIGVDAVFFPSDETMYPNGYQTYVEVTEVTKGLCGASRPGHFKGVATVVLKLFNIVRPDVALLGEKDYQQLVTIKTMVRDLNLSVEIARMPIVRETDGLAMSSRNVYLSSDERKAALSLSQSLKIAQEAVKNGEKSALNITAKVKSVIESTKLARIDYVKICDAEDLQELDRVDRPARLLLAAFVGKTRLIDNCKL